MAVLVAPVGRRIGLSALALVLCAGAGPADRARAAPVAAPPAVAIELRPLGTAEAIDALEVRTTLAGLEAGPDAPFLAVPAVFANLTAQIYRVEDVEARDRAGPLPLAMAEEEARPGVAVRFRRFTALRPSQGPIELRYRAEVTPTSAPRTLGPSYDLRGTGGGFLGGGASFLILPADSSRRFRFSLSWNLDAAPPGSVGISTLGASDIAFDGTPPELMTAFFMGGILHRFPADAGDRPFNAFWIGEPNFDAPAVMAWAARSHEAIRGFARAPRQAPYFILARPNPNPTIGGAATRNGFILEYGSNARDEASLKLMFTHEMIHHFIPALDGPAMTTSWWHEGLAEFYKLRIPLRAGLIDFATYARAVADQVAAYYRNPGMNLPNAEVATRFWADRGIQNLPYARGFMYFANLDANVRAASGGRRSLDDLVLAMLAARERGGYSEAHWRELLSAELGVPGIAEFDAMMSGRTITPRADAFGPCLARRPVTITRRILGFSDPSLQREPVVRDLDPSSAAARAGLREGDRIVRLEGWRRAGQGGDAGGPALVIVRIERLGTQMTIRFDSHGGEIAGFTWIPDAGTSREECVA